MFPILIVDDTATDAALAERTLRTCKILNPVITFSGGEQALQYFTGDFEMPVLVLLDMSMQPCSGLEVLRGLRTRGLADKTALVMLSGLGDYKTLQEGYQLGARTFLLKPLNHDDIPQLLSKVRGLSVLTTDEGYVLAPSTELSPEQKTLQFA